MNHPVKVAERIATLDILSSGRVHFGMGKGGTQQGMLVPSAMTSPISRRRSTR